MTDSRVSRGALQVLVLPVPDARVSAGAEQALVTTTPDARVSRGALQAMVPDRPDVRVAQATVQALAVLDPDVQIARAVVQVLTSTTAFVPLRPFLRTVGSSHPVQMKQADGSWWPVQLMAYATPPPPTYSALILAATPLGYYRMNETPTSGATLVDSSGLSHPGTWSATHTSVTGLVAADTDHAVAMSGSANGASIPRAAWNDVGTITLEAMVQPAAVGAIQSIWDSDDESTGRSFQFRQEANGGLGLIFWTATGGPFFVTSVGGYLAVGVKKHVAATYDGTTARIYVNGTQVASLAQSGTFKSGGTYPYLIGSHGSGTRYNGVIDEFAIYGTALSAATILSHATTSLAITPGAYANAVLADTPLGYYRMNETPTISTALVDSSGLSHPGTWANTFTNVPSLITGDTNQAVNVDDTHIAATIPQAAWNDVAAITLEAVVSPAATGTRLIWDRDDGGTQRIFQFRMETNGALGFIFWTNTGGPFFVTSAAGLLPVGVRAHVAATYDGTTARIYINGTQVASLAQSGSLKTGTTYRYAVGFNASGISLWSGVLDEFAVYGTALSAARIAAHAALI